MSKGREAALTVAFVDGSCARYRAVFTYVRHIEQFTQLELGLLAETKRKSLMRMRTRPRSLLLHSSADSPFSLPTCSAHEQSRITCGEEVNWALSSS